MVRVIPCMACVWLFSIMAWWAQVAVTPEASRIIVLSRGICRGLNGLILVGGQISPSSIVGFKLLWKKAQKKEKKNKTSETIKRIIPHLSPVTTFIVWRPCIVPSREISRHHWILANRTLIRPISSKFTWKRWNHLTNPDVKRKAPIDAFNGQGLFSTKW